MKMTSQEARQSTNSVVVKLILVGILAIWMFNFVSADYPANLQPYVVSCWTLDETSGTTAIDYGNGALNNGTNGVGGNKVVIGINSTLPSMGKGYTFNKTSTTNVSMIPSASLNISQDLALLVVFNSTDAGGDDQIAGGRINTAGYMSAFTAGTPFTKIVTSGGATAVSGSANIATGANIMMVTTHTDSNSSIYINGVLNVTSASSTGTITNSNTWTLGGTGAFDGFNGNLFEVVLLNYSGFNQSTASLLYNSTNMISCHTPPVNVTTPYITSINPTDTQTFLNGSSVTFATRPTSFIDTTGINVTIYTNATGSWLPLATNDSSFNNSQTNFTTTFNKGVYLWSARVNDSVGPANFSANRTFSVQNIAWLQSSYDVQIVEQSATTFKQNFTIATGLSITGVNLTYNSTNYSASFSAINATSYQASVTLTSPLVTANINKTFFWDVFFTDGSISYSPSAQQTVLNFGIDNCSANTIMIFNFTMKNEATQIALVNSTDNTSIKLNLLMYPNGSLSVPTFNFTQSYNQTLPAKVCINSVLGSSIFYTTLQAQYDADAYATEFYNIQNYSLNSSSNPSQNITLYDLADAENQPFVISYRDSNFLPVAGALIQVGRTYIDEGVTKTVEIPSTDVNGETVANLVLNTVIYTFTVTKNGQVLAIFANQLAKCQNPLIQTCEIDLNSFSSSIQVSNFSASTDFRYTLTYDKITRIVTANFVVPSGAVSTILLNVTSQDAISTSLCTSNVTTSSGTLTCTLPASFGNSTAIATLYKDGSLIAYGLVSSAQNPSDIYPGILVFLGVLVFLTLIGAGMSDSPVITTMFLLVGVVLLMALGLVSHSGFIGGTASIMYLVIVLVLIMIKGGKRT